MANAKETMAHRYFYAGVALGKSKRYVGQNLSFDRYYAVSYSTTIGITVPARGYTKADPYKAESGICILSFDSMSSYTARDIHAVCSASPFAVVYAPIKWGKTDYDPKDLQQLFVDRLAELAKYLVHAPSREKFIRLMDNRKKIIDTACEKWAKPLRNRRLFSRYEQIAQNLEAYTQTLKKRKRAETARRVAQKQAFLKQYTGASGASYNALLMSTYDDIETANPLKFTAQQRQEARTHLGGYSAYYCWLCGDEVRTNHSIRIPVQEARIALKAWAAGKDMRATRIGDYAVVSYTGDTIQIGCHKLERRNLLALYEVILGTPFPNKSKEET